MHGLFVCIVSLKTFYSLHLYAIVNNLGKRLNLNNTEGETLTSGKQHDLCQIVLANHTQKAEAMPFQPAFPLYFIDPLCFGQIQILFAPSRRPSPSHLSKRVEDLRNNPTQRSTSTILCV